MKRHFRTILASLAFATFAAAAAASAQPAPGRVKGIVTDDSGAVMPGVTIVATRTDSDAEIASVVTDGVGAYQLDDLPAGNVRLTYQLDGFAPIVIAVIVEPGSERSVLTRMLLAPRTESVTVVAKAPAEPPKRRPPPPPPPPPPVVEPVVQHDRDSVCGPSKPDGTSVSFGTILARKGTAENGLYSTGDQLLVEGGTRTGLEVGTNYAVRRNYRVDAGRSATLEHTSGVLQIVNAKEDEAVAVVVYACDAFMPGDALGPFRPEPIRTPEPFGTPAFDNAAKILFADVGQLLGFTRRLLVIDRGVTSDIRVGQSLTIFRKRGKRAPLVLGEATVVAVKNDSATIRIEHATDDISFGDWAAPQRYGLTSTDLGTRPSSR